MKKIKKDKYIGEDWIAASKTRNNNNVKPFKTQIAIYNLALGEMQGYLPDKSYILGNGWIMNRIENKRKIELSSENPFNKLGEINTKSGTKCLSLINIYNIYILFFLL